jgi:hypothetical protein
MKLYNDEDLIKAEKNLRPGESFEANGMTFSKTMDGEIEIITGVYAEGDEGTDSAGSGSGKGDDNLGSTGSAFSGSSAGSSAGSYKERMEEASGGKMGTGGGGVVPLPPSLRNLKGNLLYYEERFNKDYTQLSDEELEKYIELLDEALSKFGWSKSNIDKYNDKINRVNDVLDHRQYMRDEEERALKRVKEHEETFEKAKQQDIEEKEKIKEKQKYSDIEKIYRPQNEADRQEEREHKKAIDKAKALKMKELIKSARHESNILTNIKVLDKAYDDLDELDDLMGNMDDMVRDTLYEKLNLSPEEKKSREDVRNKRKDKIDSLNLQIKEYQKQLKEIIDSGVLSSFEETIKKLEEGKAFEETKEEKSEREKSERFNKERMAGRPLSRDERIEFIEQLNEDNKYQSKKLERDIGDIHKHRKEQKQKLSKLSHVKDILNNIKNYREEVDKLNKIENQQNIENAKELQKLEELEKEAQAKAKAEQEKAELDRKEKERLEKEAQAKAEAEAGRNRYEEQRQGAGRARQAEGQRIAQERAEAGRNRYEEQRQGAGRARQAEGQRIAQERAEAGRNRYEEQRQAAGRARQAEAEAQAQAQAEAGRNRYEEQRQAAGRARQAEGEAQAQAKQEKATGKEELDDFFSNLDEEEELDREEKKRQMKEANYKHYKGKLDGYYSRGLNDLNGEELDDYKKTIEDMQKNFSYSDEAKNTFKRITNNIDNKKKEVKRLETENKASLKGYKKEREQNEKDLGKWHAEDKLDDEKMWEQDYKEEQKWQNEKTNADNEYYDQNAKLDEEEKALKKQKEQEEEQRRQKNTKNFAESLKDKWAEEDKVDPKAAYRRYKFIRDKLKEDSNDRDVGNLANHVYDSLPEHLKRMADETWNKEPENREEWKREKPDAFKFGFDTEHPERMGYEERRKTGGGRILSDEERAYIKDTLYEFDDPETRQMMADMGIDVPEDTLDAIRQGLQRDEMPEKFTGGNVHLPMYAQANFGDGWSARASADIGVGREGVSAGNVGADIGVQKQFGSPPLPKYNPLERDLARMKEAAMGQPEGRPLEDILPNPNFEWIEREAEEKESKIPWWLLLGGLAGIFAAFGSKGGYGNNARANPRTEDARWNAEKEARQQQDYEEAQERRAVAEARRIEEERQTKEDLFRPQNVVSSDFGGAGTYRAEKEMEKQLGADQNSRIRMAILKEAARIAKERRQKENLFSYRMPEYRHPEILRSLDEHAYNQMSHQRGYETLMGRHPYTMLNYREAPTLMNF